MAADSARTDLRKMGPLRFCGCEKEEEEDGTERMLVEKEAMAISREQRLVDDTLSLSVSLFSVSPLSYQKVAYATYIYTVYTHSIDTYMI